MKLGETYKHIDVDTEIPTHGETRYPNCKGVRALLAT